ncbi:hypothetical protein [Deinococcus cellulosilyticus]|uniref:Lipoprotein n=1 Tax=Deinococcus cellulosilyticus (strain DSM 18568 / NBRC 106333 / KACC 11606 / 5516J-15) TaxID=1223518 RepID=A0A511N9F8_DEIC1|nr:hypothetical protein [Deinococcus cellulosilyticus]GEM49472.1 hypothetical protein DC3_51070 [Deinococcus cellulosilyticus NBRC 106333 = KACC 11606]
MKPILTLLLALTLVGCAPAMTSPEEETPEVSSLPVETAQQLQSAFQEVLVDAGITVQQKQAFKYSGSAATGFTALINLYYKKHPGFCPVVEGFFISSSRPNTYMTLTAKGKQVSAFVYDQSEKPAVTYAYLEGVSSQVLETRPCDNDQVK